MNYPIKISSLIISVVSLAGLSILTSCEGNHFANPLPVDSKDIYEVPTALRGTLIDYKDGSETFVLDKNSITFPAKETTKIINGIWFHPRDTMSLADTAAWKKVNDLPEYISRYSLKYDSTKKTTDTTENYILKGNKIYKILSDGIDHGNFYTLTGDTIYMTHEPRKIILGTGAFLRKVTDDLYIINIRESELGIGTIHWWQIRLLKKSKDGTIIFYDWSDEIEKDSSLIYSKSDHNYFDSQWTKKDILKLINEGFFEARNINK